MKLKNDRLEQSIDRMNRQTIHVCVKKMSAEDNYRSVAVMSCLLDFTSPNIFSIRAISQCEKNTKEKWDIDRSENENLFSDP